MSDETTATPRTDDIEDAWKRRACGSDYVINQFRKLERDLSAATAARDAEIRRWQDVIRDTILGRYPSARIDGGGCDSGDPLDFTLAEVNQGLNHVENERDLATAARDEAREALEELALAVTFGKREDALYYAGKALKGNATPSPQDQLSTKGGDEPCAPENKPTQ